MSKVWIDVSPIESWESLEGRSKIKQVGELLRGFGAEEDSSSTHNELGEFIKDGKLIENI